MAMWPDSKAPPAGEAAEPARPPGAPPSPPATTAGPPTREFRAWWTFAIAAAFLSFAYVLILMQTGGAVGASGAFLAGALGIAVNVFAALGLGRSRDWARYAMTPILWIYVGAGVLVFVVALSRSSVNIPIVGILAAWALSARHSQALGPVPVASTEGTLLVLGAVVAALIQFF